MCSICGKTYVQVYYQKKRKKIKIFVKSKKKFNYFRIIKFKFYASKSNVHTYVLTTIKVKESFNLPALVVGIRFFLTLVYFFLNNFHFFLFLWYLFAKHVQ